MQYTRETLLKLLEENYGTRTEEEGTRFGKHTAKSIAEKLHYDPGQFSKLINPPRDRGSSRYGEAAYKGAINRLLLKVDHEKLQKDKITSKRHILVLSLCTGLSLLGLTALFFRSPNQTDFNRQGIAYIHKDSIPLLKAFKRVFDIQLNEIAPYWYRESRDPTKCPCMQFQGEWGLDENSPYKIPIPYEKRDGYHYISPSSILFLWCSAKDTTGHTLEGLEIFENDIYFEKKGTPQDSFFTSQGVFLKDKYYNLDFEDLEQFIKVAKISSLFYNEFQIKEGYLLRSAERWARYNYDFIDQNLDKPYLNNKEEIKQAIPEITKDYIGKLVSTECDSIKLPRVINEGVSLDFQCDFYFGNNRRKIPYTKSLVFKDKRFR